MKTNCRKGLVLVMVLWAVVLLMVIVTAIGRKSRLDTKVCHATTGRLHCKWACRAGLETAIAALNEDFRASDSLFDLWSDNEDFNDVELEGCQFTVQVTDEAAKLNINTATKEQLLELPDMTDEIADAILDWRDKDDSPKGAGVESGYYKNLHYGYNIRNGDFRTIRELLLVKGVTSELLYGEDANFNDELDYNERDGDQSPPYDNGDDKLDKGWIAYLTCYSIDQNKDAAGQKRIDINKANEKKLQNSLDMKKSHAKWIVQNRPKKGGYKSISDLINDKSPKKAKKSGKKESDKPEPIDTETFGNIADKITIDSKAEIQGRVNINTASEEVLEALLGGGESAQKLAQDIISHRKTNQTPMQSIAELMNIKSVKIKDFKKLANHITTRSDFYTVRCFANAKKEGTSGASLITEAVVDRRTRPCEIVYWYQGANN